jgi:hypothetical protein
MANPAAQAHCRCQSPSESTAGERDGRSAAFVTCTWLYRLLNDRRLVDHKFGDRYVKAAAPTIDPLLGRRPTGSKAPTARPQLPTFGHSWRSVPRESSWEATLELINLGFSISHGNYLAFLRASTTVHGAYNRTNPEKTS